MSNAACSSRERRALHEIKHENATLKQPQEIGAGARHAPRRARDPTRISSASSSRYEHPLPSREWILHGAASRRACRSPQERLAQLLDIVADEKETFARRLNAMERDGQIMRNRHDAICVVDKLDLMNGRVQGHPDGFGFVIRGRSRRATCS